MHETMLDVIDKVRADNSKTKENSHAEEDNSLMIQNSSYSGQATETQRGIWCLLVHQSAIAGPR